MIKKHRSVERCFFIELVLAVKHTLHLCREVIIGGSKQDKAETIYEIADLCYHVMVLMVQMGISVEDITRELEKRHVVDHKVKQERMQ